MDESETTIVATSHIAGAMNYPSTTQALFALIVMIIVLLFILVYCCWGTFTCARQDDVTAPSTEEGGGGTNTHQNVRQILHGPHTVIVPINNMIYVGDPETHQIYQIPMDRDKPPAYTEVFHAGPPPPYRPDTIASDSSSTATANREQEDTRTTLPENPPAYDECLSTTTEEFGGEQGRDAASVLPEQQQQQQQQEHTPVSGTPTDTTAPTVTESPLPTANESVQEVLEASRTPRSDLVLTVSTLQPAEEGPHNASAKPQKGH